MIGGGAMFQHVAHPVACRRVIPTLLRRFAKVCTELHMLSHWVNVALKQVRLTRQDEAARPSRPCGALAHELTATVLGTCWPAACWRSLHTVKLFAIPLHTAAKLPAKCGAAR